MLPGLWPERRDDHRDEESGKQEHDRCAQADPDPSPVGPAGSGRERVERLDATTDRVCPAGGGKPLDLYTAAIQAGIQAGIQAVFWL